MYIQNMEKIVSLFFMATSKDHLSKTMSIKGGPSIKDHEHQRRAKKTCADIILSEDMEAYKYQQVFLVNERNKSQFISLLSKYLVDDGHIVHHSIGDADTLIIQSALELAA